MFDGKGGLVNALARKILHLSPEDHSVDFTRTAGQIEGVGLEANAALRAARVARSMRETVD
jgi:hypothetical protein